MGNAPQAINAQAERFLNRRIFDEVFMGDNVTGDGGVLSGVFPDAAFVSSQGEEIRW